MRHGYIFFEIQADDVGRAAKFYQAVFGWKFSPNPDAPIEYLDIETGGSRGGLLQRPAKTPPPEHGTNAYVYSMEVGNFDEIAGKIMKSGGQIALEKFPIPAGAGRDISLTPKAIPLESLKWMKW